MKKSARAAVCLSLLPAIVFSMAIVLASCGRDDNDPNLSVFNAGTKSMVQQVDCSTITAAEIVSTNTGSDGKEFFDPHTVVIHVNEVVKWTNTDDNNWWVKSDEATVPSDRSFYSAPFRVGESFCLKFTVPGTFAYHCAPSVQGVVIVE